MGEGDQTLKNDERPKEAKAKHPQSGSSGIKTKSTESLFSETVDGDGVGIPNLKKVNRYPNTRGT